MDGASGAEIRGVRKLREMREKFIDKTIVKKIE